MKATAINFPAEIQKFPDHSALFGLWEKLLEGKPPAPWGEGKGLEYLVLRAFQLEGAHVRWPFNIKKEGKGIVEQIDGALYLDHLAVLVEAKDHADPIPIDPIYKLRSQLMNRPGGTVGAVFARSGFTEPALLQAPLTAPQTILLWSPDDLTEALKKRKMIEGMRAKFRWAVEQALPDRDLRAEQWT